MEEEYSVSLLQEKVNALDIIKSESTIIPKSKIRVAMLQIEDRDDPFFNWCMNLNRQYCEKHDIDHIYFSSGPSYIPPYWWKVLVFLDVLNLKKHDIVCWMDSDAFVYNTKVDIREFFNESSRSMVIAPDPDGWGSIFMAAVYMAKNNAKSREIFTTWMSYYNDTKFKKMNDGKWKYIGGGAWAGTDYEQGSFAKYILPANRLHIKSVPWYVFHETNCSIPHTDCWSIHIPGAIKQLRSSCIIDESYRRRFRHINPSTYIIILLVIILLLILGIYVIIVKW